MIPATNLDISTITTERGPSLNHKMHFIPEVVKDTWDTLEAMKQVVYKIVLTERYRYIIYSWNYGVELEELFGEPISYVIPEVERRIREALLMDDRIESVVNFRFEIPRRNELFTTFTVNTIFGSFDAERRVNF